MRRAELSGLAFSCLEGCGYCCTFQPEASVREIALLRKAVAPRPLQITSDGERSYLALQSACGACTLLQRRACTQYDARPSHCRYFPFHVYFGREPEVMVNYTCRGVERRAGGDLTSAFERSVLATVKKEELDKHQKAATSTYAEFERRARRGDAWTDVDAPLREAVAMGASLFARDGLERAARLAGAEADAPALLAEALAPFRQRDAARRPLHLAPDLKWLSFEAHDADVAVSEMDETGALSPVATLRAPAAWRDASDATREALARYFAGLAARGSFAGSVFALVDEEEYETTVEEAAWARVAEVASDLLLRVRLLHEQGVDEAALADEAARFYDSAFLDAPTIGGWL